MNARTASIAALVLAIAMTAGAGPLLDKANAFYSAGKLKEAVAAYKKAALADESPALCYFNAANAYFQLDSLPQALVFYRACLTYAPDYFKGYSNLAIVYYTLNDMGNCIATIRRALQLDPSHQKSQLILAAAYRKSGAIPEAIVMFERLATQFPDMDEPYISLGEMYRDLGDPVAAMEWLNRYPHSGKYMVYAYSLMAGMAEEEGDLTKALYYNQQILELDKTKKGALSRIVSLHRQMGNDLVAYEIARQGMDQFPDYPELAVAAGDLAFRQQRYGEAEFCYTVAHRLGSPAAVIGLENIRNVMKQKTAREQTGL